MKHAIDANNIITNTINLEVGHENERINFIIMHKDLIYAGDKYHNKIIVIKDSSMQYIPLNSVPLSGILLKGSNDKLAVGCNDTCVYMIDVVTHTITNTITL